MGENPFKNYERLEDLKIEFIKINLEIDEVNHDLRNLQGRLKELEQKRSVIKSEMLDICRRTGLTIYERKDEK